MVNIDFYQYPKRKDIIKKVLANPVRVGGLFRDTVNVLQPVIRVRHSGVFNFNYCYIEDLHRYYFVDDYRVISQDVYEIKLSVDVLKTYEQVITEAYGTIEVRQNADRFISTRNNVYNVKPNTDTLEFDGTGKFDEQGNIIMVTIKGAL